MASMKSFRKDPCRDSTKSKKLENIIVKEDTATSVMILWKRKAGYVQACFQAEVIVEE